MLQILEQVCDGSAKLEDLDELEKLAEYIKKSSLCGLGQTAPNPVLSTLRHFRAEYEEHITNKKCPAGVCKALFHYLIIEDNCTGCMVCTKNCPVNAISGPKKGIQIIDQELCTKCSICYESCRFDAIVHV